MGSFFSSFFFSSTVSRRGWSLRANNGLGEDQTISSDRSRPTVYGMRQKKAMLNELASFGQWRRSGKDERMNSSFPPETRRSSVPFGRQKENDSWNQSVHNESMTLDGFDLRSGGGNDKKERREKRGSSGVEGKREKKEKSFFFNNEKDGKKRKKRTRRERLVGVGRETAEEHHHHHRHIS